MISKAKQELLTLEESGKYLFHGSSISGLNTLKPHQAYTVPRGDKIPVKDGEPAVVATPYIKIAIFRAIIQKGRSGFGSNQNEELNFRASEKALNTAKDQIGYVYILSRSSLVPKEGCLSGMDWRSDRSVKPLQVIEVTYKDLPKNIERIEEISSAKQHNQSDKLEHRPVLAPEKFC